METAVSRPPQLAKFEGGPADKMSAYLPSTHEQPHLMVFRMPVKIMVNLPLHSDDGAREVESYMPAVAEYQLKYVGIAVDTYEFKSLHS